MKKLDLLNTKETKKDEQNWYSVKEICSICNTSRQTCVNFKNDSNCKIDFTVRRNLRENDYLKKLNDFNTTQLGYYTKKYHSWYDDYENY